MEDKVQIGGIMHSNELVLFSILAIPVKPGTAGFVLSSLGDNDINVEFITQMTGLAGKDHILFCVKTEDANATMALLVSLQAEVGAENIRRQDKMGLVFTFGPDFRYQPGIAGDVFRALGAAGINIVAISTSISTVSCVIEAVDIPAAVSALEARFDTP